MGPLQRILLLLSVAALTGLGLLHASRPAPAARMVLAEISLNGEVILRGSTSDDGHPDADEVWGYLKGEFFLHPTENLSIAGEDRERGRLELHGAPTGLEAGSHGPRYHPTLGLEIAYGGQCELRELSLIRVRTDDDTEAWKVDPETVDRWFAHRRITRREASLLEDPRLPRRR